MSEAGEGDARRLSELRNEIDAIDAEMHRLLIARGSAIDSLIRTKGTGRPGAAFRPGREADMMRRLVARHVGALPLSTVEHIWREIISTFTRMQAPFNVALDGSVDAERMRDVARFYFGFSVDLLQFRDASAVVAHVARGNDLGIVAREQSARDGVWWRGLAGTAAPRIMAILPFIAVKGRPADLPAFVISPPLADPTPPEVRIFAATAKGDVERIENVTVLDQIASGRARDILFAAPAKLDEAALERAAKGAGAAFDDIAEVGGIARGVTVGDKPSLFYESLEKAGS